MTTTWGALGSPRGGTASVCRIIRQQFDVPTVVHLPIQAKSLRDIENILRGLHLDGLHNVLALGQEFLIYTLIQRTGPYSRRRPSRPRISGRSIPS